jgi:CubicO group peptidase (beta-lactamase class C family)
MTGIRADCLRSPSPAREVSRAPDIGELTRLQALVESELCGRDIPGAAVSLLRRDTVLFAKGFGSTDRETCSPITERTIFQIGSVSKLITAVAVLLLAEQGEIDIYAPIGRYAEWLDASLAALTVHQLLTHTAGLKDAGSLYGPRTEVSMRDALSSWGREYLFTTPGEVFSYSNPGYSLVGLVIECVTRRSFAAAMQDLLFAPLAMPGSAVSAHIELDSAFSAGHASAREGAAPAVVLLADNSAYRPAGYIYSTLQDLNRLLRAILDDGMLDGRQILPRTLMDRVTTMHVRLPGHCQRGYGYGLYVDHGSQRHMAVHTGFNAGFGARVCICVDTRSAVIVLTNRQSETLPQSAKAAMDMLAPSRVPQNRTARWCPKVESATLNAWYEGAYTQGGSPLVVREEAGTLWLRSGRTSVPLRRIWTHRFTCCLPDYEGPVAVVFICDQESKFRYLYTQYHSFRRIEPDLVDHA